MNKERAIDKLLGALSIEEKVAQLMVLGMTGPFIEPELVEFIKKYGLGGLRLAPLISRKFIRYLPEGSPGIKNVNRIPTLREKIFDNNIPPYHIGPEAYVEKLNYLRKLAFERGKHNLPLHMVADFECGGGDFTPEGMITAPACMGMGGTNDPDLIRRTQFAVASQIKAVGIDWIHSPVVDVNTNRHNPEVYTRAYGEDPQTVITSARAALQGMKQANLISCLKHYPGRGATADDAHFGLTATEVPREIMEEVFLKPYRILCGEGMVTSIMPAHAIFPSLDTDKEIATVSPQIIGGILRDDIGFDGVITTDSMTMGGLMARYSVGEACVRAIESGVDLLLLKDESRLRYELHESLVNAIKSGRITEERINKSLQRVWSLKWDYGLFKDGGMTDPAKINSVLKNPEFRKVGREASRRAIQLKRDNNKLLPLKPEQQVLVIDRLTGGVLRRNDNWNHPGMFWEFMLAQSPNIAYVDYTPESVDFADKTAERVIDQIDVIVVTADFDRNDKIHNTKEFVSGLQRFGKPVIMISTNPYEELIIPEDIGTVIISYGLMRENLEAVSEFLYNGVKK